MLTRIRNALRARQKTVQCRASNICEGICKVLVEEGYISDVRRIEDDKQDLLRVYLKYGKQGEDVITEIRRVSKPGRRVYAGAKDLPSVRDGLGIAVVSTSRGVLSDRKCREESVGGEVLCTVC